MFGLPFNTLGLAAFLLPLLGKAFDLNKAEDWVYSKLPEKVKAKGTPEEFENVRVKGGQFLKAVYDFLH